MLKSEIDNAVNNLITTIEECGFEAVLKAALDGGSETITIDALKAYSKFLKNSQKYNTLESQLVEMFGLDSLKEAAFWSTIVKPGQHDSKENIAETYSSIKFIQSHLPKILALRGTDNEILASVIEDGKKDGVKFKNLSVVVIEEQELSTPNRLIFLLDSIQGLYDVVGRLKNMDTQNLLVTSCDSGNDKQFDFMGSSEIIDGVKDIILSLWDRVMFFRDDKPSEQLDRVTQSLPILDEINELEKAGTLEKEEAEILRRRAGSSIAKFTQAGLTIPEMEDFTRYDPRELMRPERKSLAAPSKFEEQMTSAEPEPRVAADSGMTVVPDESDDPDDPDNFDDFATPTEAPVTEEPEVAAAPEPHTAPEVVDEPELAPEPEAPVTPGVVAEPETAPKAAAPVEQPAVVEPETTSKLEDSSDFIAPDQPEAVSEPHVTPEVEDFKSEDKPSEEPVAVKEEISIDLEDAGDFMAPAESAEPNEPQVTVEVEEPSELQESLEQEAADQLEDDAKPESPFGIEDDDHPAEGTGIDSIYEQVIAGYKELKRKEDEKKAAEKAGSDNSSGDLN